MNLLNPLVLLTCYATVIGVASIVGGRLSEYGVISHTRTQIIISFVAGFILGMAIFHLLPHSLETVSDPIELQLIVVWIVVGILVMIVMLRVFDFHQHEIGESAIQTEDQPHTHSNLVQSHPVGFISVFLGLSLHTLTEGVTLGAGTRIGGDDLSTLPGLAIALAILLHKPLDAYSITSLMRSGHHSGKWRHVVNVAFAMICPLVAFGTYFFIDHLGEFAGKPVIGYALAFGVGAFLCISLSDLLPEISFHKHDRFKLLVSLFAGIGLAYALYFIEALAAH